MRLQRFLLALLVFVSFLAVMELDRMNDILESESSDCLAAPESVHAFAR